VFRKKPLQAFVKIEDFGQLLEAARQKSLLFAYFWPLNNRKEKSLWNAGAGSFIWMKS
jgi:hypothetical protein